VDSYFAMLDKGGTIGLSIFIVIAFVKGWIVPRWAYDKLDEQNKRVTEIAFSSLNLGERAATAAEKKVP
jgi:uncharacterized ion transporter superfamily protein YfcC